MINGKERTILNRISTVFSINFTRKFNQMLHHLGAKTIFTLYWNDKSVLALFFFTFGFYGWGTTAGISSITSFVNLLTTLTMLFSTTILYLRRKRFNFYFQGNLRVELRHLFAILVFFLIGIAFNFRNLSRSLTVDELAHAWSSQLHAYVLANKIDNIFPTFIGSFDSRYILQSLSFTIVIIIVLFFFSLSRISTDLSIYFFLTMSTLVTRLFIQSNGGIDWPNSPLGHFWHFMFSSVFGVTSSLFRMSNLILFAIIAAIIYFYSSNELILTKLVGFCSALLVFTIPLLSSLSTSPEIASWSLFFTMVFFGKLIRNDFTITFELLFLIAIGYYFRVNLIALFVACLICLLAVKKGELKENMWGFFFPLLVVLPGLFPVFFSRLFGRFETESSNYNSVKDNFENSIDAISNSGSSWFFLLFLSALLILITYSKSFFFLAIYLILQGFLYLVLNNPLVSGSSKYLAEFFFPPVLILGILPMLPHLKRIRGFLPLALTFLLVFNSYGIVKSQGVSNVFKSVYNPSVDAISSGFGVIPYTPFPYAEAFSFIQSRKIPLCLNAGVVYSEMPRVLTGSVYSEVSANIKLRSKFLEVQKNLGEDWKTTSFSSLSNSDVQCVILGAVDQPLRIQKELTDRGWLNTATFVDSTFGTKIYLMTTH